MAGDTRRTIMRITWMAIGTYLYAGYDDNEVSSAEYSQKA
jgi:hypothetical protein